jgi:hypothetical protein
MARKPSAATISARALTTQTIADDIAEFRKRGGRIEVLGNTHWRRDAPTAFHSDAALRKAPTPVARKTTTGSR